MSLISVGGGGCYCSERDCGKEGGQFVDEEPGGGWCRGGLATELHSTQFL